MPLSFPNMESLVGRAEGRHFRPPYEHEAEPDYRKAFANFMQLVDRVEASEIRAGNAWNQQSPESVLFGAFSGSKDRIELYVHKFEIVELSAFSTDLVRDLAIGTDARGRTAFVHSWISESNDLYNRWRTSEPDLLPEVPVQSGIVSVMCHPKQIRSLCNITIGGVFVQLVEIDKSYCPSIEGDKAVYSSTLNLTNPGTTVLFEPNEDNKRFIVIGYHAIDSHIAVLPAGQSAIE